MGIFLCGLVHAFQLSVQHFITLCNFDASTQLCRCITRGIWCCHIPSSCKWRWGCPLCVFDGEIQADTSEVNHDPSSGAVSCLVATRLNKMMRCELDIAIDDELFWSDSMCVLSCIANQDKRFQTFVANRITTIHDGSRPTQWKYIKTGSNPADVASGGLSAE